MNWIRKMDLSLNKPKNAAYMFIAPAVIIVFLFNIVPLITSIVISTFNVTTYFTNTRFVGLHNYVKAFHDTDFLNSWKITIIFTIFDVPVSIGFALLVSAIAKGTHTMDKIFRSVYILPLICSATVIGLMWHLFLNPSIGWGIWFMQSIGLPKLAIFSDAKLAIYGIIFVSIWRGFGVNSLILVAAMQGISNDLYEAADLDGATKFRQFFSVTIPGITSTLWFIFITRVIGSFQVFDLIYIITKGGPANSTMSVVNYIFNKAFTSDNKLGYATAMSEILFLVILLITIMLYGKMLKQEDDVGGN